MYNCLVQVEVVMQGLHWVFNAPVRGMSVHMPAFPDQILFLRKGIPKQERAVNNLLQMLRLTWQQHSSPL